MAPENATNTRAAAVPMLRLTGLVFNGSTKVQIGGEQGHDAQDYDHGHGAQDDGDLDFLMALTPVKFTTRMKASNTMAMAFALTLSMP